MTKKKMKKINKKIRYAMYKNYDNPVAIIDNQIVLKPIPAYIVYSRANQKELKDRLDVMKRELRRLDFAMRHASPIIFMELATTRCAIWGMVLGTQDYIRRQKGITKTFRLHSITVN